MNINKFIIRLYMFTLLPSFPSLLTFIIFTIYKLYFDPVALCDNGCAPLLLEQLKENLKEETGKSSAISGNIVQLTKIIQEIKENTELTTAQEEYNKNKFEK